jgi:acetoacetyl-CoA reductase/3-oxoacyl-[acyl-carrier protein] reductase
MAPIVEGRLSGRIAVVTGAANGIGRASALRLAREGADLAVVDREGEALQAVGAPSRVGGRRWPSPPTGPMPWLSACVRRDQAPVRTHRHPFNNVGQSARERERVPLSRRRRAFVIEVSLLTTMRASRSWWRRCGPARAAGS